MLVDETAEPRALPLSLLEDITGDFSHAHEIGRGGFAVVYKGILGNGAVAVKRLTNDLMDEMEFHREVECLMRVKHKNVVRFLGYCANRQGTMERYHKKLVMADVHQRLLCFEYVPQGSLDKYIIDAYREWGTCYRIIGGICEGLQYLHENNIIHLDLKPANILLGNNMVPKITDFGLSRCFDENQSRHITKNILGTLGYLAPELRDGGVIARSADLYSLGVIIIEILTGQKGYQDIGDVLDSWSDRLERSQQDTLCEQIRVCYEIALECIDFSPKKRPASARNIIDRLHEMRSVQNPGFANEELATIHKGVADFNFNIDLVPYEERNRPLTNSAYYPRHENAQYVHSDLVGDQIKKNTEELEHKLIANGHHKQCSSAILANDVGVGSDFDELKDIGMKIVKKCDGLPLAIKVMGGLLSRRDPKERDWKIVLHKNLGWKEEDGSQEELNYSVSLSYDDLSPKLKQCFLYYSLLPKGSDFEKDTVISMWISEEFVQHDGRSGSDQLDLEEIGDEYHRELVARNLLEPTENVWVYTLHDVVRSFAQFITKEEAFVVHKDQADIRKFLPENKRFCRLSIELTDSELEWSILENQEKLRTLLINCEIKSGGSVANFANLRVLDIRSKELDLLVEFLCELRHLRYLSLSNTSISGLPDDIHKIRFLQHIRLKNCTKLEKLPNSITKLACLRYLDIYGTNVDVIPRGFGGLTNLRTLGGFPVKMDGGWCTLEELEALSHLRNLSVHSLENVPGSSVAKRAKISDKKSLEYLDLSCYKDDKEEEDEVRQIGLEQQERIEAVYDELCPPPRLETLIIERYYGRRLPNWLQSPAAKTFNSLKIINLLHITYCTRLPDGLCRMHTLEKLRITYAPAIEHVGPEFQTLARGDGGVAFPSLRKLVLSGLSGWKEWGWEEEQSKVIAMPALEHLRIRDCKLTLLPSFGIIYFSFLYCNESIVKVERKKKTISSV